MSQFRSKKITKSLSRALNLNQNRHKTNLSPCKRFNCTKSELRKALIFWN